MLLSSSTTYGHNVAKLKVMVASGILRIGKVVSISDDGADCQIGWAIRGKGGNRLGKLQGERSARSDSAGALANACQSVMADCVRLRPGL